MSCLRLCMRLIINLQAIDGAIWNYRECGSFAVPSAEHITTESYMTMACVSNVQRMKKDMWSKVGIILCTLFYEFRALPGAPGSKSGRKTTWHHKLVHPDL